MDDKICQFSHSLQEEILIAAGIPKSKLSRALCKLLFQKITHRLAELCVHFDILVRDQGLPAASSWMVSNFCSTVSGFGIQDIPRYGPLLVVTNHPGTYDALILFAQLNRPDICWISHNIPAFHLLPNMKKHVFFASQKDPSDHFVALRDAIKHLRSGGALVYIGSGGRDPDPGVYPDAESFIDHWLDSFDIFFKYVPDLQLLPVVISNVISPRWTHHPITLIRRQEHWKMILAEFSQVISQVIHPRKDMLQPAISFGLPVSAQQLRAESTDQSLRTAIIQREKKLLSQHLKRVTSPENEKK